MTENKLKAIFCDLMTNEILGLMLRLTEAKIDEYMGEMPSSRVDPLVLESEVTTFPNNISIINFQEDKQAGELMTMALHNLNSIYAVRNPDPKATTADGMDYGFNTVLRETILKDEPFFTIKLEYPLIDETTLLVDLNVTLTELRLYGIDSATVLTPFMVIGNSSIQTQIRWDNLTIELDMITTTNASTNPASFLKNGYELEPIFESITLVGGAHTIDFTVSIFVPLDRTEVDALPMGYILDWASLEPCIPPVLSSMVFSGLEVTLGGIHEPKFKGIASQAIDQLTQKGVQFGLVIYEEKITALIPYLFQTTIRDKLNTYQKGFHCPAKDSVSRKKSRKLEEDQFVRPEGAALYVNIICAFVCVCMAALAAGLTMGLLSLDEMMLLIKERAGPTERERKAAASLLPIVRQHHLLLVSLLLLNALANEALPLFLDKIVGGVSAVVISVVLVLFFGEIIPSAVFTGPDQIKLASRMAPVVRTVMCVLSPIAWPIAKLLDILLHDESGSGYSRGELTALVRIQYEEHLASKRRRKSQYRDALKHYEFNEAVSTYSYPSERSNGHGRDSAHSHASERSSARFVRPEIKDSIRALKHQISSGRTQEIHVDEVAMVEGALKMHTTQASEVYTPWNQVFTIPSDMILNERNAVKIYRSGFSRIPIYVKDEEDPDDNTKIIGILASRQLMVIDSQDQREVSTLPLSTPRFVSPHTSLVDLINMFQTGGIKGGHLALVCARPETASEALKECRPLPEEAGLMGYVPTILHVAA
jgi:metal transporter CNNM